MTYDFSQITPRLLTGGAPADTGFVQALADAGVTHIVDVTDAEDDTSLLAGYPGIAYLYNPTADDGSHKDVSWFQRSLAFALPALVMPHARIYAHCSAGVNRGPSTAYCIMRAVGWEGPAALALLKEKRPQVQARYSPEADEAIKELGYE